MRRAGSDARAIQMWKAYIAFLERCPVLPDRTPGTAVHHILWRAGYPPFKNSSWNLLRLRHADHTAASALMLSAEPSNPKLVRGYVSTLTMCGVRVAWRPRNSKELIRLYVDRQWTLRRLAKKYKVGYAAVKRNLLEHGVPLRCLSEIFRWRPTERIAAQVVRSYKNGKSVNTLTQRFHISQKAVRGLLIRRGITLRSMREARLKQVCNPQKLVMLYVKNVWNLDRLAARFKASPMRVRRILLDHGVKLRTRSEARRTWYPKNPELLVQRYKRGEGVCKLALSLGVSTPAMYTFLRRHGVKLRTASQASRIRWDRRRAT